MFDPLMKYSIIYKQMDIQMRKETVNFFVNRRPYFYIYRINFVPWCNWLTRLTLDQKSLGSSPSGTATLMHNL
jgi:hypothetical protein